MHKKEITKHILNIFEEAVPNKKKDKYEER